MEKTIEELASEIIGAQEQLSALLESVAYAQDWRPEQEQWSFRYLAAHLATVDRECYWQRVSRIAAGEHPHFASYYNTGRDFSHLDLQDSLRQWEATRQQIVEFACALPEEKRALTGTHESFGRITVRDVLQLMLDHDREHLDELGPLIARFRAE